MIALAALLLSAQASEEELRARIAEQPRAVRHFVARREMCRHWVDEEPYDDARRREIERALRRDRCGQIEADEVALRHRFARYPQVISVLDETRDALGW
ncbi:MAG: hypothetical protein KF780_13600 [Sphingomonas sp.]|nr:hypothetical protein [Sphingomonas sp.]